MMFESALHWIDDFVEIFFPSIAGWISFMMVIAALVGYSLVPRIEFPSNKEAPPLATHEQKGALALGAIDTKRQEAVSIVSLVSPASEAQDPTEVAFKV